MRLIIVKNKSERLIVVAVALLIEAALLGPPQSIAQAGKQDKAVLDAELKKLEGTWQLVSAHKDGKETPAEVVKKIRVVIKGSKHSVYFGDEAVAKEIPFTFDPARNPKTTIDMLPDGKEIKGIYKLDGDMLTSCVAEADKDRPSEFASKPGSGHTLRVFKRAAS